MAWLRSRSCSVRRWVRYETRSFDDRNVYVLERDGGDELFVKAYLLPVGCGTTSIVTATPFSADGDAPTFCNAAMNEVQVNGYEFDGSTVARPIGVLAWAVRVMNAWGHLPSASVQ